MCKKKYQSDAKKFVCCETLLTFAFLYKNLPLKA